MDRHAPSRYLPLAIGAALLALLALLATVQYRWIGDGSILERQRLQTALFTVGSQLAQDFDREITRAFLAFRKTPADDGLEPPARLAGQYERWLAETPYPRLIREVFYLRRDAPGGPALAALRLQPPRLVAVPWPAELEPLRRRLAAPTPGPISPIVAEVPGLMIFSARPPGRGGFGDRQRADHVFLWLDAASIENEILPELARRHFGNPPGASQALAVLDREHSGRVIFLSDPRLPARAFLTGADLEVPMFGLRRFDELRRSGLRGGSGGVRRASLGSEGAPPSHEARDGGPEARGVWRLVVKGRHGSLEEAVSGYRHRNLAISGGILALLAITIGLMLLTTQRARRLALQQLEFVAAVSHELRTPVAAILAAGQNLADGVVATPAQVKLYGALVEREGRRLSGMVGQVLEFAGIQSGRQAYSLQATEVGPVLDAALADCRGLLAERQARVETDIAAGLPPVQGDPAALRHALRNLIENAAKYGGPDPWIGVRARPHGGEVEITVEDRGIGVDRADAPHLFEPFFRGREAVGRSIAGSGLGLSVVRHIVRAHRGRVSLATEGIGRGSAFTLHLPAAAH